jgi:hypothetical protein
MTMTVQYSAGCTETFTRFIKDMPAACTLTVDNPDTTILKLQSQGRLTLELINTHSNPLTLDRVAITYVRPNQVTWTNVTFPSGGSYAVNSSASGTVTLTLNPQPAGLSAADVTVPANGSLRLTLNFTDPGGVSIDPTDFTKICVTYRRSDLGTTPLQCRILNVPAPDASTNNPTSCD